MIRNSMKILGLGLTLALLLVPTTADATEWGSLKGRFVVDGTPPTLPPLVPTKDAFCIETHPINEAVVTGEGGGLANAVVYIRLGRRDKLEINPEYAAQMSQSVTLNNHGCAFVPHMALVRTGQEFIIKNSDPTGHNTNAKLQKNGTFNVLIPEGAEKEMTFSKTESLPMPVNCNIHPFMSGHILVLDHPYMAASAADGTFEIKDIPAGKHEFQFWHEVPGYLKNVSYDGGSLDRRGRVDLTIEGGQTLDLGEIKVPTSLLQ